MTEHNPRNGEAGAAEEIPGVASTEIPTMRAQLYNRYLTATLIDLTVLNLFEEHSEWVVIQSFSISLLAAVILQLLLKASLALEHQVAVYFGKKEGGFARFLRYFVAYLILVGSKFVMLGALDFAFGSAVEFTGPFHGIVIFVLVVIVMVVAEELAVRIYRLLAR